MVRCDYKQAWSCLTVSLYDLQGHFHVICFCCCLIKAKTEITEMRVGATWDTASSKGCVYICSFLKLQYLYANCMVQVIFCWSDRAGVGKVAVKWNELFSYLPRSPTSWMAFWWWQSVSCVVVKRLLVLEIPLVRYNLPSCRGENTWFFLPGYVYCTLVLVCMW